MLPSYDCSLLHSAAVVQTSPIFCAAQISPSEEDVAETLSGRNLLELLSFWVWLRPAAGKRLRSVWSDLSFSTSYNATFVGRAMA